MKKSLSLLMFVCMSISFNAYAAEVDPTIATGDDLKKFNQLFVSGDGEYHIYKHAFYPHKHLDEEGVAINFFVLDADPRYVKVTSDEAGEIISVEYCDKDGAQVYGPVFNGDKSGILNPNLSKVGDVEEDIVGDGGEKSSGFYRMVSMLKKPAIIATVSAAAAGTAYAITKYVNKQWNKQYNAKKVATFTGIGAGIMTGVYLYWPEKSIDDIDDID